MSWMAVGAIAELVAAFAVVGSVVYLAIQVRNHYREARIAAMHELTEAYRASILSFQDGRLAELFSRAKTDFETLDEPERLQFISMVQGMFRVWEDAFHQHREGRLDERIWRAMVVQYQGYLSLSGVIRVWEIRRMAYSEEFRKFVDSTEAREYLTA